MQSFSQSEAVSACCVSAEQRPARALILWKDVKLLLSRVTSAHMAPYATVHAFLNDTRELHMSLNASSRHITAAELHTSERVY